MSPRFVRLLAAPVAVAVLALAAGAAAAAPAASASDAPLCVWQSLYLYNGWQSAQSDWNTGDPAYCVVNSAVYLRGSLKHPASGGAEFAALPPQALPTSNLDLDVYTYGGTVGQLTIWSNGEMYATGGSAGQYTSLAGISFPVAGTKLNPIWLLPGWVSAQNAFGTGDPSYADLFGIIYWTGSIMNPNPNSYEWSFDEVPPPDRCTDTYVYTYGGHVGDLINWPPPPPPQQDRPQTVFDTTVGTSYRTQLTSLAGISYPSSQLAAWQPVALQPGWGATNPYPPYCTGGDTPSYYVQDHVVYLSGELAAGGTGGGFFGTLPAAARPQHDLYLTTGDSYVHISPNGEMWSPTASVNFGNISYQASS